MLQLKKINAFVELGKFLSQFSFENNNKNDTILHSNLFYDDFIKLIQLSQSHNGWFTQENVYHALQSWAKALTKDNLNLWLSNYSFYSKEPKIVGLVLAGNIPLVGFHDFLSVVISGNKALIKTSSNDQHLIKFLVNYLVYIEPDFKNYIEFIDGKLENFDAVIATGSNNTSRYFDYYFKDKPNIIRKNRNSIAVLSGTETDDDLQKLGEDIFTYFGLGCRNVSKLFVPRSFDFQPLFKAIYKFKDIIFYNKYSNNYDYNKAVFLMSNFKLLDNEFLTLKEDTSYASPISSVFYEYYDNLNELNKQLKNNSDQIQCIVSNDLVENSIAFGTTQRPELWDYPDNVDTLEFLLKL